MKCFKRIDEKCLKEIDKMEDQKEILKLQKIIKEYKKKRNTKLFLFERVFVIV